VNVTIVGDLLQEGNETFTATLSNLSSNATLGDGVAVATILDDECLFCENFEDGILPLWDFTSPPSWIEIAGFLLGSPSGSAQIKGLATPVFPGCATCTVTAALRSGETNNGIVTLIAWHQDANNKVELQMKEGKDKWTFRQRRNGSYVTKKSISQTIDPDTVYQVEIHFDGTTFSVVIDGVEVLTHPAEGSPNGTVGIAVKRVDGSADHLTVLP
jgi:hypothetical protein